MWEEKGGFTKEMMDGARKFYHAENFNETLRGRMILWTVIDGKIYKEYTPKRTEEEKNNGMEEKFWPSQIHLAAKELNFPKRV